MVYAKIQLSTSSEAMGKSLVLKQKEGFTSHLGVRIAGACPGGLCGSRLSR